MLHEAVWAPALKTPAGRTEPLGPDLEITPGRRASRAAHNARLARMHAATRRAIPGLTVVKAPESLIFSDPDHVWGQSPFHYIPDYYAEVWRQLGGG